MAHATILVVDDEQLIRWSLAERLRAEGHEVLEAATGAEALERARDGVGFLDPFRPGEWVSLHWNWVCDRLSRRQLHMLRRSSLRQLDITNGVSHPGARAAID